MREGLRQARPLGAGARSAVLEDLLAARGLEGIPLQVEALVVGADAGIADLVPSRSRDGEPRAAFLCRKACVRVAWVR